MKRTGKIVANVLGTLVLTYALLQLVFNVSVVENALNGFYNLAAWNWFFDKFDIYGAETQEAIIDDCLGVMCLLVSIGIVYAANRLLVKNRKSAVQPPISRRI